MNEENKNISYPRFISSRPCGVDKFEGQSHARLTNAIGNHITSTDENKENNLPRIIGLEGGWGVGKSNVIIQLKKKLKEKRYYLFEYDAWGYQEDLQRRSFLETMTRNLIENNIIDSKWEEELKNLLAHKITRNNKTVSKFSAGALWTVLFLASTPITVFIAERLENSRIVECFWFLTLIAYAPILLGVILWLFFMIFRKEMRSIDWILQISKNENIETKNTETINEEVPNVTKFKEWMKNISDYLGVRNKKLIIVYDNMDRLPAEKIKELWSSIHTFFSEGGFDNVWAIIPFDEKHLACAFGENDDDKRKQLTKYFISKTFPIVYRVAPPISRDFAQLFDVLFKEAFGNTIDQSEQEIINHLYRSQKTNATVREMIEFINQMVILKNISENEIYILHIAIFVLIKDGISENVLDPNHLTSSISETIVNNNDDDVLKNISALAYGVTANYAEQIPLQKHIEDYFNEQKDDINKYSSHDLFPSILKENVSYRDLSKEDKEKLIATLASLNFNNKEIMYIWEKSITRECVKTYIEEGKINESNFKQILDVYKILTNNRDLDLYLSKEDKEKFITALVPFNDKDRNIWEKIITKESVKAYIEEGKINESNFKQILDAYKKITKKNEFPKLKFTQNLQNTCKELLKKTDSSEYLEIVTIQLGNINQIPQQLSDNTRNPTFDQISQISLNEEQIKIVSENIDYYGAYGSLLIYNISNNIPILNSVLKHMTESNDGKNLDLKSVLPQFNAIKDKIGVSEKILLSKLNDWERFKNDITKDNIQTIIPNAEFFKYSVKTNCYILTDYLNKTIVEKLSEVSTDTLYKQRADLNDYWLNVSEIFIDTVFLKKTNCQIIYQS